MSIAVPRETDDAVEHYFGARRALAERYADALATSGVERGLIGPREVPRLWERHLLNCAALVERLPESSKVVDVGSGAGLPGVVIALARPDLTISLVEPLLRRVTWLDEVVEDLGLTNVTVLRGRAEEPAVRELKFDVATSRAVAPLRQLAAWSFPLVRPGGALLAIKGASAGEELAETRTELAALGGTVADVVTCGTSVLDVPTTVVEVHKSADWVDAVAGSTRRNKRRARRS